KNGKSPVTAVAFARQSCLLATGGSHDRRVTVADWRRLVQLMSVDDGHGSWVVGLRWSRDDRCLASWAEHDCVRLWRRRAPDGEGGENSSSELDYSMESEVVADLERMCSVFCCSVDSPHSAAVTVAGSSSDGTAAAAREKFQLDDRDLAALSSGLEDRDSAGGNDDQDGSQADDAEFD
uniref:WD_REPEATS_REGION domain-containing protein n=1 Tax=Macrostomum lignano TaxID=282301 RepID=A0A1I8JA87_9PLAT